MRTILCYFHDDSNTINVSISTQNGTLLNLALLFCEIFI